MGNIFINTLDTITKLINKQYGVEYSIEEIALCNVLTLLSPLQQNSTLLKCSLIQF